MSFVSVSIGTPASAWRAASCSTTAVALSARPAEKIVSWAPVVRATSTARLTAFAAVLDPSVPTRIFWYTAAESSRRALLGRWPRLGELGRRGHEALDRPEGDALLALRRLGVVLHVDDHDLAGAELLVEQALGHRVLDEALDGTPQRPGAQRRVVALVGEVVLGGRRDLDADALALELHGGALDHQVDDLGDLVLAELVEHDRLVDAVQELRPEVLLEGVVDLLLHLLVGDGLVGLAEAHRRLAEVGGAQVRGHDQHGVAEVDRAPLGVGEATLLEDLQQRVEDVGVGLLDLVEEHHRERLAAHGLGELAALVVADVARGGADEPADRVLLHVLGHVEADHRLRFAEEELGELLGQLGLADTGGAEEDERAARALR